ncbi:cysteine desulfurase [Brevibacillus ruminantium]|uniref:Cysteine desulfurase n=1 Tax=Brevibacillus ruminantium TaxID=2950604 RepID=A0ABY4WIG8_9BACL|nr:cysteine desulfurase family protein [Brevibacillus ruminantium]USG65948.1 cysteine desulfurase [Brevibacillus ruminantium]
MSNHINHLQLWEHLCQELGELLGLDQAVPSDVLHRALKDDRYAGYVCTSAQNRDLLRALIQDPKNQPFLLAEDFFAEKTPENSELLVNAQKLMMSLKEYLRQRQWEEIDGRMARLLTEEDPEGKPCKPCAELQVTNYREVYLDHCATTYVRPEVGKWLSEYYLNQWGFANPSSNTLEGRYASDQIERARKTIADCLSVSAEGIIFTGSGSEANNLAIKGIAMQHWAERGHLITSKVEHSAVLQVMNYLETLGFSVTYLDVDKEGRVSVQDVENAIRPDTILVSIMAANNEIGTLNPIGEIGQLCKARGIPFMVDAIQAFGRIPLHPEEMGISLLSFSGHKMYAPKGVGGLYVGEGIPLQPLIHGGGQERELRAGTENVASIVAMGKAAELMHREMEQETERLLALRDRFLTELGKIEDDFVINGSLEYRAPHNLSIGFAHVDSGALLRSLNRIGISTSISSACHSRRTKTSHVLEAIGADTEKYATIRFSFGLQTREEDLLYLFQYLPRILELLREEEIINIE